MKPNSDSTSICQYFIVTANAGFFSLIFFPSRNHGKIILNGFMTHFSSVGILMAAIWSQHSVKMPILKEGDIKTPLAKADSCERSEE